MGFIFVIGCMPHLAPNCCDTAKSSTYDFALLNIIKDFLLGGTVVLALCSEMQQQHNNQSSPISPAMDVNCQRRELAEPPIPWNHDDNFSA